MAGERVHAVINNYPGNRPRPRAWSIVGKMPHCADSGRSRDNEARPEWTLSRTQRQAGTDL